MINFSELASLMSLYPGGHNASLVARYWEKSKQIPVLEVKQLAPKNETKSTTGFCAGYVIFGIFSAKRFKN